MCTYIHTNYAHALTHQALIQSREPEMVLELLERLLLCKEPPLNSRGDVSVCLKNWDIVSSWVRAPLILFAPRIATCQQVVATTSQCIYFALPVAFRSLAVACMCCRLSG